MKYQAGQAGFRDVKIEYRPQGAASYYPQQQWRVYRDRREEIQDRLREAVR